MSNDNALDAGLQAFQEESSELLAITETTLLKLEEHPDDPDLIGELFRSVHTIKGASGVFGFEKVVSFTHVAESVMGLLRESKLGLDQGLISIFLDARDHMEQLIEAALAGTELDQKAEEQGSQLLQQLEYYLDIKPPTTSPEATPSAVQGDTEVSQEPSDNDNWHISLRFPEDTLINGMDPMSVLRYLQRLGDIISIEIVDKDLPKYEQFDPEKYYLGWEIEFSSSASIEEIEGAFEFFSEGSIVSIIPPKSSLLAYRKLLDALPEQEYFLGELLVKMGALSPEELKKVIEKQEQLRDEENGTPKLGQIAIDNGVVEKPVLDMALNKQEQSKKRAQQNSNQTIRINPKKLGYLIDLVGELVISSAHIRLQAKKFQRQNETMFESAENMAWLVDEIRSVSLGLRMVPIGDTFGRYRRVVRDLSQELSKDINFLVEGGETELDKTVVEKISDPLMHMVRNAIDHGIEPPEERTAKGKNPAATLTLKAYHESGSVSIEVCDDGKGLDKDRILAKAVSKGLINSEREKTISEHEIYQLIFAPGFSTAETISNVSGRGVGMDVVKRNVEELRGTIEVNSKPGFGCTFTIRLPLTLAIIDGFHVQVNECAYIIPLDIIDECIELDTDG